MSGAAAAVSGARHLRAARNGQDAAAVWFGDGIAAAVVCDGCGSAPSSEVGARLGAQLVLGAIARHGADWVAVRAEVIAALAGMVAALPGPREQVIHDLFLFTIVAAVLDEHGASVWAIGDGAFALDGVVHACAEVEDNQPPYLAYDLLGDPRRALVHRGAARNVLVATDGVAEIGLARFTAHDRYLAHPDALRRELTLLARSDERIAWDARRVVRTPALLQDDGAVALLVRT